MAASINAPQVDNSSASSVPKSPIPHLEWQKLIHLEFQSFRGLVEGEHDTGQLDVQDITKTHWVTNNERSECVNPKCKKKFSLTERKHHCRRCGEIFCWACTSFQRRLSVLAEPDPVGKQYKVCYRCYDLGPQTIGQIYSHTAVFHHYRSLPKPPRQPSQQNGCNNDTPFDVKAERSRLLKGFEDSIGNSKVKSTMTELISPLSSAPEWQRSHRWTFKSQTDKCQRCKQVFSWLAKKYNCKVCGCVVCAVCSTTDLVLYIPDECTDKDIQPRLAIIKIVGCPEVEPDVHLYLRVCNKCKDELKSLQVEEQQAVMKEYLREDSTGDTNTNTMLLVIQGKIVSIQEKIDSQLPKYQKLIDGLEIGLGCPASLPQVRSNTQILAKAQGDLSDHFTNFAFTVMSVKQIQTTTPAQQTVIRNLIKCKFGYYHDNMYLFRQLKKRLEAVTPSDVLERIQQIVDKNAINGAYLVVIQIAYETLDLCMRYKVNEQIALIIRTSSEVIIRELKQCIVEEGENWDKHKKHTEDFVKSQLKGTKDGEEVLRFVKPSKRLLREKGSEYLERFLPERCHEVVLQVILQLHAKCSDKKFKASKESLKSLQERLSKTIECEDWDLIES